MKKTTMIGLLIASAVLLTSGIGILSTEMREESDADRLAAAQDRAKEANDRLKGSVNDLAEAYRESAEYGVEFLKGIESAKSYLDYFDDSMFASEEERQALADEIKKVQDGITSICQKVSDEQRSYTAEESKQLDDYFERLKELQAKELEWQKAKTAAVVESAKSAAKNFGRED